MGLSTSDSATLGKRTQELGGLLLYKID